MSRNLGRVPMGGTTSARSQTGRGLALPRRTEESVGRSAPAPSCGQIIAPPAHLVNPPHRLAAGPEQQDGAVVDDDLYLALVVFDDKLGVLDGAPALGVAVGAAEVEVVVGIEERRARADQPFARACPRWSLAPPLTPPHTLKAKATRRAPSSQPGGDWT